MENQLEKLWMQKMFVHINQIALLAQSPQTIRSEILI